MILDQLILNQFKNYTQLKLNFNPKFNLIVGNNGVGKTNLLDAIYYLSICKSYFQHQDRNVVQFDKDFFTINGQYNTDKNKKLIIHAKVEVNKQKKISYNKKTYKKLSDHIGKIPVVIITPSDIQDLTEGSEERRKLLDTCISQYDPLYLQALVIHSRILKQRNAYLKSLEHAGHVDEDLLQSFDKQLLAPSDTIHKARLNFIEEFNPLFNEVYQQLSQGHEQMSCAIKSHLAEGDYLTQLLTSREKDLLLRRTSRGVHKDDLKIQMDDRPMKTFASQGQIKSGILSIKLAQYKLLGLHSEQKAILILDDIFDKLDRSRVSQLISFIIDENFGQVFISDTHPDRVQEILKTKNQDHSKFEVNDGNITLADNG